MERTTRGWLMFGAALSFLAFLGLTVAKAVGARVAWREVFEIPFAPWIGGAILYGVYYVFFRRRS